MTRNIATDQRLSYRGRELWEREGNSSARPRRRNRFIGPLLIGWTALAALAAIGSVIWVYSTPDNSWFPNSALAFDLVLFVIAAWGVGLLLGWLVCSAIECIRERREAKTYGNHGA